MSNTPNSLKVYKDLGLQLYTFHAQVLDQHIWYGYFFHMVPNYSKMSYTPTFVSISTTSIHKLTQGEGTYYLSNSFKGMGY